MKYITPVLVAIYLCFVSAPAGADERVLPAGTEIRVPKQNLRDGEPEVMRIDERHFLIERDTVDWANAQADTNRRLADQLERCREETAKPEPGWSKWQWAGAGGAVVVAFLAGLKLGSL